MRPTMTVDTSDSKKATRSLKQESRISKHTKFTVKVYLRSVAMWEPPMIRVSSCSMAQGSRESRGGRQPSNQPSGSKHTAV